MRNDAISSDQTFEKGTNRRSLLRNAGLGGAALGGLTMGLPQLAQAQTADDDVAILNLAYLEAEFYSMAVFGHGLSAANSTGTGGNPGYVNGGGKVNFSNTFVKARRRRTARRLLF